MQESPTSLVGYQSQSRKYIVLAFELSSKTDLDRCYHQIDVTIRQFLVLIKLLVIVISGYRDRIQIPLDLRAVLP